MKTLYDLTSSAVAHVNTKYRKICTPVPHPDSIKLIEELRKYETESMHDQLPLVWDRAVDFQVFDGHGNCFIDLSSTIFVANVGHSHPKVVKAIKDFCDKPMLNGYYYPTQIRLDFVKKLLEAAPEYIDKCILYSTGSETTECSFKAMRQHGKKIKGTKIKILSFTGSFHGKTTGAQQLGGKDKGKAWITNLDKDIHHLPFPTPWYLEESKLSPAELFFRDLGQLEKTGVDPGDFAGVMIESYQGWGAIFYPEEYIKALCDWAKKNDVVITVDEVQSGFGRTGKLFCFEHYGIKPDIICCGKAISSSLPLSAVIGRKEIIDTDASMNSTHGGNPMACAASLASLNALFDENLIAESERKGRILDRLLANWQKEHPDLISGYICKGLVAAVFFTNKKTGEFDIELVDQLIYRAMLKGVNSIRTLSGTIKIGPPLTIPDEALVEAINVYKESLNEMLMEKNG